jgi:hypothetical protein
MRTKFFITAVIIFKISTIEASAGSAAAEKEREIRILQETLTRALHEIRETPETRGRDFLALLPGVSITRSAPYGEVKEKETYMSVSLSMNQVFTVAEKNNSREIEKRKASRRVESLGYKIRKLINRKYKIADRIWRYRQIKRSAESPVEIARYDEKISELEIKIEDIEMDIEEAYAEIDFICAELGR